MSTQFPIQKTAPLSCCKCLGRKRPANKYAFVLYTEEER